jgi:hypothetical protein
MTNQNPRLPSHIPSQCHLTWHSGTKVVASEAGFLVWLGYVPVLNYVPFR